jgi:putative flippase GtrA
VELLSRETLRTFLMYVFIGIFGVLLYMALLWCFLRAGVPPIPAFTLSYVIAVSVTFVLNRYLNFKSFERAIHKQAGVYVVITVLNYVIMIAVEAIGIGPLRLSPMLAYMLSIPVNLPVAYLAHRFLTFGPAR